jgi:hypothetical protein
MALQGPILYGRPRPYKLVYLSDANGCRLCIDSIRTVKTSSHFNKPQAVDVTFRAVACRNSKIHPEFSSLLSEFAII